MVNGSTVYGDESDCASQDEFFLNLQTEVGPGGEVWGYVCREIAAGDVTGMLLRMTDTASGTDYWFDLSGE